MLKKQLFAIAGLLLCAGITSAADVGLGVSAQSDDSWIYLPIEIGPRFRVEPSLRYVSNDVDQQSSSGDFGITSTTTIRDELTSWQLAVGLFGKSTIAESIQLYYGARFAYIAARMKRASLFDQTDFNRKHSPLDPQAMAIACRRPSASNT